MSDASLDELVGIRDLCTPWLGRLSALWPDRVALVDPDTGDRYTYLALHRRSLAVAGELVRRGVQPGDRVAALMNNSVLVLDLVFACDILGAIFVPINWRLSGREVDLILRDTSPRVTIAEEEFIHLAQQSKESANLINLETLLSPGAVGGDVLDEPPIHHQVRMSDPWIILYTGGTTGTPKGAVLTHASVTWNAINTGVSWGLSERDIGPNFTPMFHTGGLNVFTLPLLMLGGRIILPRRFDPGQALSIIEQERPSVLFMVPTMYQLLAEHPDFPRADLSSLRWAISGGAPCPQPIYECWKSKVSVFKQGYGLTEAGPNNFATPDEDAVRKQGTVGRLTFFVQARIIDDDGQDVPVGQTGELLLAGPHLFAGYWQQLEATRETVRNGWLHTGDLARRDDEGYYYIVDRKKDMIVSGGENIYPTEVESVLYTHQAVREAVVVGRQHVIWGEEVCAVVSFKPGRSARPEELREHMRGNLARYKIPKDFIIVDSLPRNAAGKILRQECKRLVE